MTNKHLFSRLQIQVCPKGLHSFAFYILIFAFSSRPLAPDPSPLNLGAQESESPESENVRKITYEIISKNLQNKANFLDAQMNVSTDITTNYEQLTMNNELKNEPNTNPNKPNLSRRSLWRSRIKANFKGKKM
jgi:hypothetical protein